MWSLHALFAYADNSNASVHLTVLMRIYADYIRQCDRFKIPHICGNLLNATTNLTPKLAPAQRN